jgi:hypothetical protein
MLTLFENDIVARNLFFNQFSTELKTLQSQLESQHLTKTESMNVQRRVWVLKGVLEHKLNLTLL